MSTTAFELVSPEEKLVSEPASMVVIPGDEGEFGVLSGHSALVASLRPGVVEVYTEEQKDPSRKIFIAGGFADVTESSCTVLAEEAIDLKDLDQDQIEQQISNLNEDLGVAQEQVDKARIEKRLNLAKAKLSAITGKLVM